MSRYFYIQNLVLSCGHQGSVSLMGHPVWTAIRDILYTDGQHGQRAEITTQEASWRGK